MSGTVLLVGTRKGLWIGTSDEAREDWSVHGAAPQHGGGLLLHGRHPQRAGPPLRRRVVQLARAAGEVVRRPGRDLAGEPRRRHQVPRGQRRERRAGLAARARHRGRRRSGPAPSPAPSGARPTAGASFRLEQQLWDHPHRKEWGAGFGGQAFHTILPHPSDPDSVTVAISSGGVYQTADGGASWAPRNQGVRAEFLPEGQQYPEFGQCVHKMSRHPSRPERLFMQNHGGVYRSDDHAGVVDLHRRRAARRLRVPGRGAPARAGHGLRLPAHRQRRALPTRGQGPGLALPRTPASRGRSSATGCPTTSSSA